MSAEPQKLKRLLIGVPLHRGESRAFRAGCIDLAIRRVPGWEFTLREISGCGIVTARDLLACECVVMKYDALLFLASDIGFTCEQVRRVCSHFGTGPEIVGGCYVKKTLPLRLVFNPIPGEDIDRRTGLLKVWEAGTDFMFIARSALERVIAANPELAYDRQDEHERLGPVRWNIFNMGIHTEPADAPAPLRGRRRHLTEDYWWCMLARKAGIATYVDTEILLDHEGTCLYRARDIAKAPAGGGRDPDR